MIMAQGNNVQKTFIISVLELFVSKTVAVCWTRWVEFIGANIRELHEN